MELNPYLPPSPDTGAGEPAADEGPVRRPVDISLLAGLFVVLGVMMLGLLAVIATADDNDQWSARTGVPIVMLLTLGGLMAALVVASGVSLWLGKKWGWWLAAWYYVSGVLGNAVQLLLLPWYLHMGRFDSFEEPLLKHGVRLAFDFMVARYLFGPHVKRFFGLQAIRPWRTIAIMLGISLLLGTLVASITAYNLISTRRAQRAAEALERSALEETQQP